MRKLHLYFLRIRCQLKMHWLTFTAWKLSREIKGLDRDIKRLTDEIASFTPEELEEFRRVCAEHPEFQL